MSKLMDVKPVPYCKQISCDRCGLTCTNEEDDFNHFVSLDFETTFGSPFGDGIHVDLDTCHQCVKEALGQWLKLSSAGWNGGPRRVGFLKGRIINRPDDWLAFFEMGQTISEDFMQAVLDDRKSPDEA